MAKQETFSAFVVRESEGVPRRGIEQIAKRQLPPGEVVIAVRYSSVNYKDAMAAEGHPGVVKTLPHVPGIDAAGIVIESESPRFSPGDEVIVTGYGLGADQWGGWSEMIRVPADWVVSRPENLSLRDAMILGTAGFTAAQCVASLQHHGISPDCGPVVVTGSSGGVGSVALMILSQLGYEVTAVSGKSDRVDWLMELGARQVIQREAVLDESKKPLLKATWAGAVDTVGGQTLVTLVRSLRYRGTVACCGLVGGSFLPLTVYPFLLRGVTLDGIDSAACPYERRLEIWEKLAGAWKPCRLEQIANEVPLQEVERVIPEILAGRVAGRTLLRLSE